MTHFIAILCNYCACLLVLHMLHVHVIDQQYAKVQYESNRAFESHE